ncbi:hypothetical protein BGX30_006619, partial [Mortierella sp. GBA39]
MTDNRLNLFCLVDGEATSNAFSVKIHSSDTVDDLKKLIKTEKVPEFDDIATDKLTLWSVSIPDDDNDDEIPILLDNVTAKDKKKLRATRELSEVFSERPPKSTIHIIVQRPPPGDLRIDIKRIMDKFFAPGPIVDFLNAFVRDEKHLDVTTGQIRGLPRAWRRQFGQPGDTRPSLLFMDLPDPSSLDAASRNLAAGSILDMVKENNRPLIPVFGVSGCGKTRAVIELLSQHWGFYFNASSDDWGSSDMMTLHSTIDKHLQETRKSFIEDRLANNAYARKTTLLLFISRLLILKQCLHVPGCNDTFTSARWTLLQTCPHVLFDNDIFDILFRQVRRLRHHSEENLSDFVTDLFESIRDNIIKHGCLPRIKTDTRLLVVLDEAQLLGDAFNASFQSISSSDESPRPLLSPILHAFRDIGGHQLTLVACGTGLSINTLFWVQSSGSGLKDSSTTFQHMEFPGWTDQDSIVKYISRVRKCLRDDQSKLALDEHIPKEAMKMLFEKFAGRFRPAIAAI